MVRQVTFSYGENKFEVVSRGVIKVLNCSFFNFNNWSKAKVDIKLVGEKECVVVNWSLDKYDDCRIGKDSIVYLTN